MKVLLSWLKEFVDVPVEASVLAEDLTLAGLAVDGVQRVGDDLLLELDITTNRVDCMNVYGVAREVAALYGTPLRPVAAEFEEPGRAATESLAVEVEAPELCPRFCARVLDVKLGPSPAWLRGRLEAVGVRPINNVVDLTNYVMLELGHPSHAFDLERIPQARLRVRWAREGERLTTLDGVERSLTPRTGVVAGADSALALAGIMGGASSEVSDATRVVALEAAYWEPLAIRRAARALGMHTEASHRFERDADPEAPPLATARIAHLLQRIGAGSARPGLIDVRAAEWRRRSAPLRPARVSALLGTDVPEVRSREILERLGFGVGAAQDAGMRVQIPSWRGDVSREVDLIEEVGRHFGVNRIPSRIPPATRGDGLKPEQVRERALRQTLVAAGLAEAFTLSFAPSSAEDPFPRARVAVANPLSVDQDTLRRSLVFPGLLAALRANLRQGRRDVRVFEIGRTFDGREDGGLVEQRHLGILWAGAAGPAHWSQPGRSVDFFDLKGLLEAVEARLALAGLALEPSPPPALLHPGKSARVFYGDSECGWLGAVHPVVAERWELKDETLVAELRLDELLVEQPPSRRVQALPRFPAVSRDLSALIGRDVAAATLLRRVREAGGSPLRSAEVTDRYEGAPVPADKVSLTLTLRYQLDDRTLTGEEVQASLERVAAAVKAAGGEIRGE